MIQNKDPYAPIRVAEFRNLLTGRITYIIGVRMMSTIIGWWIYVITESKLALGLVGLSEFIPAILLALPAGNYLDRKDKKSTVLFCITGLAVCVAALLLLSSDTAHRRLNHWTIATIICIIIGITGVLRAFSGPGLGSMIGRIVPKDILGQAATMSSAAFLSASVLGHITGGFLIEKIGIHNTFFVVLALVLTGLYFFTRLNSQPALSSTAKNTWAGVKEGLAYVFKTKELVGAMSLDMFAVLFGGAVALIPVFARDILGVGSRGLGLLNGASDIGSLLMVTLLTLRPLKRRQGMIMLITVMCFGACIIAFGLSKVYMLSVFCLFLSGCFDGISVVIRSTILQLKTPDELRGRVMSVSGMFINSSNELGQFESGLAARLLGTVPAVVFGGIMTIGVGIITWFKAPSLRRMEY